MRLSRAWLIIVVGVPLFAAGPVKAETAADKATAREAAMAGIQLYRAGKYADALDRLRRAEALYDAPVHLLYIARAQDKLGQLVEAAENYRLLDRYVLPAEAPEAWISAVSDGRKELAALTPRIPQLRITSDPAKLTAPALRIDDVSVAAAVLGLPRPIDPGKHHIELSAEGYAPAATDVDIPEGSTKDVTLTLVASASATPASVGSATPGASSPADDRSLFGLMFGLRIGAALPTGKILAEPVTGDVQVSDGFQGGASFELHAGLRIARYFTPVLYFEGAALSPGNGLLGLGKITKPSATALGLGLIVGTPPNRLGGFGEVDVLLGSTYALTATLPLKGDCDLSASGGGVRFGGGDVPVSNWLHITPFAMATLGRFTKLSASSACSSVVKAGDIDSADERTHAMVVLGVGGDIVLGKDRSEQ